MVGIYLPMIPEVVVAMLACARIGAIHNVVFGGFSAESVRERMEFSEAKALVTVDGARRKGKTAPIKPAVDEQMGALASLKTIVVVRHTGIECPMSEGRDVFYDEVLAAADPECPAEPMEAEHPLYILYTSGSTAKPKGILHTTGGYMTGVTATHRYVFDLKPESDVYWCAADVGWVTGHSYIVYGPLANGATSVMWEGAPDYPRKGIWWELIERYKATILYAAPTAIRTFIKWGAEIPEQSDLSSLRLLGSVGEPINPKAWLWYHKVIGGERCPIVDTWWQTETGAIMITPLPGITATKPGSATTPFPGVEAQVVEESEGEPIDEGQGLLVLERPWPSMLRGLYKEDDRFVETYFSRFGKERYLVGDAARRDADGYFWVIGRIDDVVNVSGHRLSTAEVESAIVAHEKVAEAAVIGQSDEDTGQAICAFVTLRGDTEPSDELVEGIRATVAERIGKFARPKRIIWADDLPKTRSGKIMRRLLRDIAEGRALGDVTTLRDPDVMEELEAKIAEEQRRGLAAALVGHALDRDLERLQLFLDAAQFAQRHRLGGELLFLQLLLDLGDFGGEEALGEGAGEQGDEADADDEDDGGDDLAAGRRRVDVGAERGHRRDRPVEVVPEVEVLVALEGAEEGGAADHGQQRQQQRVAQPLEREDLARELGQAQQAQQPQQAQGPQALQAGGQDRRGEEDDDDVERVVADPGPAVGDDRQHHHQLDQEGGPGDPVEDDRDRLQGAARLRLGDRHRRQRQRRRDQHRRVQLFRHPGAAGVHPRRVADGLGCGFGAHRDLIRRRPADPLCVPWPGNQLTQETFTR